MPMPRPVLVKPQEALLLLGGLCLEMKLLSKAPRVLADAKLLLELLMVQMDMVLLAYAQLPGTG